MSGFPPKRAFTFIKSKSNEDVYEISILLNDVQGAVAKTAQILANANVDIRTGSLFTAVEYEGKGYWTAFIDMSKASKNIKQLEKELKKLDVVSGVKIKKPRPALYDIMHFPILHGSSRAVLMPLDLFSSLWEEVEKILTPSGFEAVLYNAGKKSGRHMIHIFSQAIPSEPEPKSLAEVLRQATQAIGWGMVVSWKMNPKRLSASIEVKDCFEAVLRKNANRKVCHWTRGFLAGYISYIFGKPVEAVEAIETRCFAEGSKTCRFQIKRKI